VHVRNNSLRKQQQPLNVPAELLFRWTSCDWQEEKKQRCHPHYSHKNKTSKIYRS